MNVLFSISWQACVLSKYPKRVLKGDFIKGMNYVCLNLLSFLTKHNCSVSSLVVVDVHSSTFEFNLNSTVLTRQICYPIGAFILRCVRRYSS